MNCSSTGNMGMNREFPSPQLGRRERSDTYSDYESGSGKRTVSSFTDPRGFIADEYIIPVGKQVQNELPELQPLTTQLKKASDRYRITGKTLFVK